MRGVFPNANGINLFLLIFLCTILHCKLTTLISFLHCKLVPVQYGEYEYGWTGSSVKVIHWLSRRCYLSSAGMQGLRRDVTVIGWSTLCRWPVWTKVSGTCLHCEKLFLRRCNLLEVPDDDEVVTCSDGHVEVSFRPFQITTLLLYFDWITTYWKATWGIQENLIRVTYSSETDLTIGSTGLSPKTGFRAVFNWGS